MNSILQQLQYFARYARTYTFRTQVSESDDLPHSGGHSAAKAAIFCKKSFFSKKLKKWKHLRKTHLNGIKKQLRCLALMWAYIHFKNSRIHVRWFFWNTALLDPKALYFAQNFFFLNSPKSACGEEIFLLRLNDI